MYELQLHPDGDYLAVLGIIEKDHAKTIKRIERAIAVHGQLHTGDSHMIRILRTGLHGPVGLHYRFGQRIGIFYTAHHGKYCRLYGFGHHYSFGSGAINPATISPLTLAALRANPDLVRPTPRSGRAAQFLRPRPPK